MVPCCVKSFSNAMSSLITLIALVLEYKCLSVVSVVVIVDLAALCELWFLRKLMTNSVYLTKL